VVSDPFERNSYPVALCITANPLMQALCRFNQKQSTDYACNLIARRAWE
jgi:hypothetical protein